MELTKKIKNYMLGYSGKPDPDDEYEEDYDDLDYVYDYDERRKPEPVKSAPAPKTRSTTTTPSGAQIVSINTSVQMKVVLVSPVSIEESGSICDYLKENKIVIVNLEATKHEVSQRIVDFLGGVSYAIDGDIQSISNRVFIIAPSNVDISGHFKEELRSTGILFNLKSSFK